ncbi:HAMP domain-containing protein, partial [bacterium]|nr:HAMP domain-containing protein [bacterium]
MFSRLLVLLSRVRIGPRLVGGFLVVAAGCGLLGYSAFGALSEIRAFQVNAASNLVPSALNLAKVQAGALRVQRAERTLIAYGIRGDEKGVATARAHVAAAWKTLDDGAKGYAALPMGDKEAGMWRDTQAALADWKKDHEELVAHAERKEYEKAQDTAFRELKTSNWANDLVGELIALQEQIAKDEEVQANAAYASTRTLLWTTIGAVTAAAVGLGLLLTASVTRPLVRTVSILEDVAKGDLSQRADVSGRDELARMAAALNTAIGALQAAKAAEQAQAERDRAAAEAERRRAAEQAERDRAQAERDRAAAEQQARDAAELRRKVDTIQVTVTALAAGDFTQAVPDLGSDVVGQMAAGLNAAV